MFRTLDRYIFREVSLAWVAVTGVLMLILVSSQLARILGLAAENGFPREVVLSLIWLTSVQNLTVLVPVGVLLAIVLALGRLYHESEMAAVRAGGVGPERLYVPILMLAIPVTLALCWLTLDAAPRAMAGAQQLRAQALREAQFGRLEPGKFRSFSGGTAVFYAESLGPNDVLQNVFLERRVQDRIEVAIAARAEHHVEEGGALHVIILRDGVRYEGIPGQATFRRVAFKEHGIPVRVPVGGAARVRQEQKSTAELARSSDLKDISELQWRWSLPLMVLTLTLLAVPLSSLRPRQGRYARVGFAILVYFLYSNLISVARVWIEKGQLDPRLGLWWVHVLMVVVAMWLLNRQSPFAAMRVRRAP